VATDLRWCRITQSGVLRFDGPDAQSFLQSQLTNNVLAVDDAHSQYTGYCTPKGRLLACMLLWRRDGAYCLMLPRELCEPIRKRLSMYILRAKVKAADISGEQVLFGVAGADAASTCAKLAGTSPGAVHGVSHGDGITLIQLPVHRYLIAAPATEAGKLEAALAAAANGTDETLWNALNIEAGIPNIVAAPQEQFVPQTVNFDLIGAVSFDKGCYPGQEIVARTHYLGKGKSKQRMVRARVTANTAPTPGDKLYSQPFGDQACGMIVAASTAGEKSYNVLAVIQTSTLTTDSVHWQSSDGPVLQIQPLPYRVV
jgi:folate-binding protein YgfZ